MSDIVVMPKLQLKNFIEVTIENTLRKILNETENKEYAKKLFTINQASKELGRHRDTIVKMIKADYIKTTPDGKYISGAEIMNYKQNKKADS